MSDKVAGNTKGTVHDASYAGALVSKWANLLEGIQNPYVKKCTAVLMENQSIYLRSLEEDTRSTSAGSYTKYIFPLLRRVFPNLIAQEIVSVQPGY